ncbi:MAG: hypothetical protein ACPGUV_14070, partial [Polyangiales bacterium]
MAGGFVDSVDDGAGGMAAGPADGGPDGVMMGPSAGVRVAADGAPEGVIAGAAGWRAWAGATRVAAGDGATLRGGALGCVMISVSPASIGA